MGPSILELLYGERETGSLWVRYCLWHGSSKRPNRNTAPLTFGITYVARKINEYDVNRNI